MYVLLWLKLRYTDIVKSPITAFYFSMVITEINSNNFMDYVYLCSSSWMWKCWKWKLCKWNLLNAQPLYCFFKLRTFRLLCNVSFIMPFRSGDRANKSSPTFVVQRRFRTAIFKGTRECYFSFTLICVHVDLHSPQRLCYYARL
jgi:hypothetical protein